MTTVTKRELEYARHAALGLTNEEIGAAMSRSPTTAKTQMARLQWKLATRDRAHTVATLLRAGVLHPLLTGHLDELPGQQTRVLQFASRGQTDREIGAAMFISENTVKTHLKAARRTIGARSRTHAVAIALSAGIIR